MEQEKKHGGNRMPNSGETVRQASGEKYSDDTRDGDKKQKSEKRGEIEKIQDMEKSKSRASSRTSSQSTG